VSDLGDLLRTTADRVDGWNHVAGSPVHADLGLDWSTTEQDVDVAVEAIRRLLKEMS
jgi:hypothetical protein